MIVWRVSNHATLDGAGGMRAPGRWHSRGRRVVYAAPNPATALLEVLVHAEIDLEDVPVRFRYLEIEVPDTVTPETLAETVLKPGWRTDLEATRRLGDEWLRSGRAAVWRVPSAVVPATWNILINPQHPESAAIRIAHVHEQAVDKRLLK